MPMRRFPESVAATWRQHSGLQDSGVTLVRDSRAWEGMWRALTASYSPVPALPVIDFSKEMVIVAALGERHTGAYAIKIEAILDRETYGEAHVRRTVPGRGCGVPGMRSAPADIVVVPRREWGVRTTIQDSEIHCTPR